MVSPTAVDPLDPLGRIADHGSRPYPAPDTTWLSLVRYWEQYYTTIAAGMLEGDLEAGIAQAKHGLAEIEKTRDFGCPTEDWPELSLETSGALLAREGRLEGMRVAYTAEVARRVESGGVAS